MNPGIGRITRFGDPKKEVETKIDPRYDPSPQKGSTLDDLFNEIPSERNYVKPYFVDRPLGAVREK